MGRTQKTHTESKQVKLSTEMIKICVSTLFFCSIAGRHFLIQTEANVPDKDDDYNDKADPPDTLIDGSKVEDHVSDDEPFKCGQEPTSILHPSVGSEELCSDEGVELWGFVDGKCKMFLEGTGCGAKLAGFDSKDECQRACKGQDYQAPP